MLKYNNHQLSETSEKNICHSHTDQVSISLRRVFSSSGPVLACAQCAFNFIRSQRRTPRSRVLKANSPAVCMIQTRKHGLARAALVLGHEDRLEELQRFTVVFKNLFLRLKNVVPDLERRHLLKRRDEVPQLSVPFLALLGHKIILYLLATYSNNNKMNLQIMQTSIFNFFILSLEVSRHLLRVSPASPVCLPSK